MGLTKIDDRGLKTPIDLQDNEKIRLGTGNDLQIYHDGTDNLLSTSGTVLAVHRATTNSGNPVFEVRSNHGATNQVKLQVDGDGDVLIPTDTGKLQVGVSQDLQIYHSGTNSVIDNNTGDLVFRNNVASDVGGNIIIQAKSGEDSAKFTHDGSVELRHDGTKKFETTSSGVTITSDTSTGSLIKGVTRFCPSGSTTVKAMWDETGFSGAGHFQVKDGVAFTAGNSSDLQIYHDGSNSKLQNSFGRLHLENSGGVIRTNTDHGFFVQSADGNTTHAEIDNEGLKFNGDTAGANALNDYEEGNLTWVLAKSGTPSLGSTNGSNVKYVKVGRLVHISGRIRTDGCGSDDTGFFVFQSGSTLPFTPETSGTSVVGHWRSQDKVGSDLTASISWVSGSTTLYLYTIDSRGDYSADSNNVPVSSQTNLAITFSLTYRTNA